MNDDLSMGGKFEGYDIVLLGRVGEKEVYSISPTTGGDGVWITVERSAGDVKISEIIESSRLVSAHTAWLKYLMDRSAFSALDEKIRKRNRKFGFGTTSDSEGGDTDV